jgi:Recombinase zinc beta ribbon domain
MLDIGIVDAQEWGQLQVALKARARNRTVRTTKVAPLHDILFCGRCGAKIYRWHRRSNDTHYGRCRNEIHRSDVEHPCDLPMIRYEKLQGLAQVEIEQHRDDPVWERVTNGSRQLRLDDIARELLSLMPEFNARMIDREEFIRRQTALMNEQEMLERIEGQGPRWQKTGETVGQKWDRLDEEHRRLWLLRIGTTFTVDCEKHASKGRRYRIASSWRMVNDAAGAE